MVEQGPVERKKQFHDQTPKKIKTLEFGVSSTQDIVSQSVVWIQDRNLYDLHNRPSGARSVTRYGPLDPRLGTSNNSVKCETCNQNLRDCNGHFGYVKLALPVLHIGFMKNIIEILHCICKDRRSLLKSARNLELDGPQRENVFKKVIASSRKTKECEYCGSVNGSVRKVPGHPLKIIHDKYSVYNRSTAKTKKKPASLSVFEASLENAKKLSSDLEKHMRKAVDDLNPLRILDIFQRVSNEDCELLGLGTQGGRPEMLIWQYLPAPPLTIRPSVQQESASTEDGLTVALGDIIQESNRIEVGLQKGQPILKLMDQWNQLQLHVARYINSEIPSLRNADFTPMRSFCQRLKGKQGRFRGNLSGKRVDFSGRTVISPDPNLSIDEVAVPRRVATNMTYPERAAKDNIEKLRGLVRRGSKYPGANCIIKADTGRKAQLGIFSRNNNQAKLDFEADKLQIGDVVERHLEDGDVVLFNRQPSLHKLSIMCHRVQVKDYRTFRLNECVCTPYNADFDGDEMNLHVPQTEEARAEALQLMGVKHNLATPKDGTPIIAATQDFITCTYLLSNKDRFYNRKAFSQICSYMFDADVIMDGVAKVYNAKASSILGQKQGLNLDIPEPAILKPEALWTGKQVFNVLMRPSKKSEVLVNFDAKCKEYRDDPQYPLELNEDDTYVCVRNSEVMCGLMDKAILGTGKKDSIFYVMMRDYGPEYAVHAMNRMAKLSARWLTNEGFSIGITDVTPGKKLTAEKAKLINNAQREANKIITSYRDGTLDRDAGCNEEQTMENRITGKLNEVRANAGRLCFENLSKWNSAVIMAKSGSKGSNINVAQMVALVGQQAIAQARVANGFQDRTLPHFQKAARHPAAKGFVSNSFYTGLTPTEFIFHAMSGREGLVDTAVKTAETGYMSRRLVKSLEDLSVQYDDTVRNSVKAIVQFQFGDDRLDPVDMEGKAKPVDFNRTFLHAQSSNWNNKDSCLTQEQIHNITESILQPEKDKLLRGMERLSLKTHVDNCKAKYWVKRDEIGDSAMMVDEEEPKDIFPAQVADLEALDIDQHESTRNFLDEIQDFVDKKANTLAETRQKLEMPSKENSSRRSSSRRSKSTGVDKALHNSTRKITERSLREFVGLCLAKYNRSKVRPGHAVGCVGAQSIGEPGTQMTLKTFHFAGVAGMSITQGVPRIKEIINASKVISTPVISCQLYNPDSEQAARMVKGQIEKTFLRDIISWISEVWTAKKTYLRMMVNFETIYDLHLQISIPDIVEAITKLRGWKIKTEDIRVSKQFINVYLPEHIMKSRSMKGQSAVSADGEAYIRLQALKRALPDVIIKGYPGTSRAIIAKKQGKEAGSGNEILVEGYGLRACMNTTGVDGTRTKTNNVMEMKAVLGIEAARSTIITELNLVMGAQMSIDPRHMQLLADCMTYKGDVLGITRFGLSKMRDSVLQLASFEKTADHLFEAAARGKQDRIRGVSECIIMGQSMNVGTGAMEIVRDMELSDVKRKKTVFEDAFETYKS